jgi:hypothetical protein
MDTWHKDLHASLRAFLVQIADDLLYWKIYGVKLLEKIKNAF